MKADFVNYGRRHRQSWHLNLIWLILKKVGFWYWMKSINQKTGKIAWKDFSTSIGDKLCLLLTGSARLNDYKKGGNSLMGRYLNFRLHPLSYGEILGHKIVSPEDWKNNLITGIYGGQKAQPKVIDKLLRLSGFPEPYFEGSDKIMNIWRQGNNHLFKGSLGVVGATALFANLP